MISTNRKIFSTQQIMFPEPRRFDQERMEESDDEIDVISVGDESIDGSASTNSDSKPKELEGKERPTQKLRFPSHITAVPTAYPTLQSTPSSSLSSPLSGSAGSACYSPPVMKTPVIFPSMAPQSEASPNPFLPHPALRLPNVLPFLATSKQHEEAMMAAIVQQRLMHSLTAMSHLINPQAPNPFLMPFMNRNMANPVMMKPNPLAQQQHSMRTPLGNTMAASMMRNKESETKVHMPAPVSPTANEKLETVNGGYGIKNPLAKNPALQDHLLQTMVEKGEDNFICKVCKKKFPLQRLLNRHVKCHSAIKRYLCTFCGKGFNDTFDLKRHTRTHTGVRPYKCLRCNKAFTQRCSLESHCKKVHNEEYEYQFKERRSKLYVCEQCGAVTDDPEGHFLHLKEYHPGTPALQKCYDKRQFKFSKDQLPRILQHQTSE